MRQSRAASTPDDPPALRRARAMARLMDSRFQVLGYRFGLDGLIGLAPVAGDALTALGGLVMLQAAHELGLSWRVKLRILSFVLADLIIGAVPVLGDVFDFVYKSNMRSLREIERAWEKKQARLRATRPQSHGPDRRARRR